MVSRALYTCMSLSVDPSSPIVSSPDEAYIAFSKMSYQVTRQWLCPDNTTGSGSGVCGVYSCHCHH